MTLYAKAGDGGHGCCSFRREKYVAKGGPDGGDGGRGGHVIFRGDEEVDSLLRLYFTPHQRAENGGQGRGKQQHGRNGKDLVIPVPCGTIVYDKLTGVQLGDIVEHDQEYRVASGGEGGLGNVHWKRSTHQAPREHTPGKPGGEVTLQLELKSMADMGLVGFPNAGKSSLLAGISHAHPKVGAYPFTTLNPVMGTLMLPDYTRCRIADIPGLIEGAHEGVGLGHGFLRHIERSRFLLFVVDMAAVDGRLPWEDLAAVRRELELHDASLLQRPYLMVANKMDLPEAAEHLAEFRERTDEQPIEISAADGTGLEAVKQRIFEMVRADREARRKPRDPNAPSGPESGVLPSFLNL